MCKVMPTIYVSAPNVYYTFELPVHLNEEVLVGTAPHCQLSLPGVEGLGEVHASISCQPQGYVITDLGTPYGTLANGVPIQADYLRPGMEYRMGALTIVLPAVENAVMPQQVVQQAPAPQQAPAAAAPKQASVAKKKASPLKTGGAAAAAKPALKGGASNVNLPDAAERFKRKGDSAVFNMIYVIVLITAAIYAGVALRHWSKTGNYLPGIVADSEPGK